MFEILEQLLYVKLEFCSSILDEPIMMSIASVSVNHWDRISSYVNHAAVFIDVGSAEVLHWHGGLMRLVNAGATDVREFSSFEVSIPFLK